MTIIEILESSKKDLGKIHQDNIIQESAQIPVIFHKYHQEYTAVRFKLLDLKKTIRKMEKEKYEYYSGHAAPEVYKEKPFGIKLKNPVNIQKYVNSDPELSELKDQTEMLEEKEKTLERILYQINQRQWHIRNMNESMKFFNGDS